MSQQKTHTASSLAKKKKKKDETKSGQASRSSYDFVEDRKTYRTVSCINMHSSKFKREVLQVKWPKSRKRQSVTKIKG